MKGILGHIIGDGKCVRQLCPENDACDIRVRPLDFAIVIDAHGMGIETLGAPGIGGTVCTFSLMNKLLICLMRTFP